MIDIDCFKDYNDFFGHLKGDACLQKVAKCISKAVTRPRDIVARYGGEEFVVVLPETDLAGAEVIAEKIKSTIWKREIEHPASEIADRITVSIGVSTTLNPTASSHELCDQADKALYRAKHSGRNTIRTYSAGLRL